MSLTPIVLNLQTNHDVTENITVFGSPADVVDREIDCGTIPVNVLYDGSNCLFSVWQGASAIDISGDLVKNLLLDPGLNGMVSTDAVFKSTVNERLTTDDGVDLNTVIGMTAPVPFTEYATGPVAEYKQYATIGDLVLAHFAKYLFGHVQATAAITNDSTIVSSVNSKVAASLVENLLSKDRDQITALVQKVVGQDPLRLRDEDNSELSPNKKVPLKFIPEDVIYFKVTLPSWTYSISTGPASTNDVLTSNTETYLDTQIAAATDLGVNYYHLKFTLAA